MLQSLHLTCNALSYFNILTNLKHYKTTCTLYLNMLFLLTYLLHGAESFLRS